MLKVLISPVMSKPGETDDSLVSDFKREIEKYLKSSNKGTTKFKRD